MRLDLAQFIKLRLKQLNFELQVIVEATYLIIVISLLDFESSNFIH